MKNSVGSRTGNMAGNSAATNPWRRTCNYAIAFVAGAVVTAAGFVFVGGALSKDAAPAVVPGHSDRSATPLPPLNGRQPAERLASKSTESPLAAKSAGQQGPDGAAGLDGAPDASAAPARDVQADVRRVQEINDYNRRLMETRGLAPSVPRPIVPQPGIPAGGAAQPGMPSAGIPRSGSPFGITQTTANKNP